jgi:predicted flap endonuclease-1-like 5' DNA nuclease
MGDVKMPENNNEGQDYLAQLYNLQQQYMKNLQQMMQPQPAANPMEQMFKAWMPGNASANPFAQMQNPMNSWTQADMSSMSALYQQMNDQLKSQLQNPFASLLMPGMQNHFKMPDVPDMSSLQSPFIGMMQSLFSDDERSKAEDLMNSIKDYQQVSMEINHLMAQLAIDSLEKLQKKVNEKDKQDISNVPQWWVEITQSVFEESKTSEAYQELQKKLEMVQAKLADDKEQYRETLAQSLGLVTEKTYHVMQMQLESLQKQITELSEKTVNQEALKAAADDFTVLNGIGQKFNEKLHQQGVNNLKQLASMSDEMLKNLDGELQTKGKVFQDQWREQAEQFLNSMSGKPAKK